MSWIDDIQTKLEITLGDGKTFTPIWDNSRFQLEFNVSSFEFPNLSGTFIQRRRQKGKQFELNLYFTGESNLDASQSFLVSAQDSRSWKFKHPYYDNKIIVCQPISAIQFDRSNHNVTSVKVTVQESTVGKQVLSSESKVDTVKANFTITQQVSITLISSLKVRDLSVFASELNAYNTGYSKRIETANEAQRFNNLYKSARSKLSTINVNLSEALQSIQAVAQYPHSLSSSVFNRANYLIAEYSRSRTYILALPDFSSNAKRQFEMLCGNLISALMVNAVTNYKYTTKSDVSAMVALLIANWNQYVMDLDTIQDIQYDVTDSYAPNALYLIKMEELFANTIGALETIGLGAKQEFEVDLLEDSDPINLTFKFYGGNVDDNLETFIEANKLSLVEHLWIKKGRRVKYYA